MIKFVEYNNSLPYTETSHDDLSMLACAEYLRTKLADELITVCDSFVFIQKSTRPYVAIWFDEGTAQIQVATDSETGELFPSYPTLEHTCDAAIAMWYTLELLGKEGR